MGDWTKYMICMVRLIALRCSKLTLLLALAGLPMVSQAGFITGAGAMTCGSMLENIDTAPNEFVRQLNEDSWRTWWQGYISALNVEVTQASVMESKNPINEFAIVKQYCRQNLTVLFHDAVTWYYSEQIKKGINN